MTGIIRSTHGTLEIIRGHIFGNGGVAVTLENSDVVLKETNFIGFETVVEGSGDTSIDAQRVTHVQGETPSDQIPLEILRRIANVNV